MSKSEDSAALPSPQPDSEAELREICGRLRAYVVKHNLGLGNEELDELVMTECDRLRSEVVELRGTIESKGNSEDDINR